MHSEGLRHRHVGSARSPTWQDKVYDATEFVGEKVSDCVRLLQVAVVAIALLSVASHALDRLDHHTHGKVLKEMQPSFGDYVHLYDYEFMALLLYRKSSPAHVAFIKAARTANTQHHVNITALDCDEHGDSCSRGKLISGAGSTVPHFELGDDEPIVLFYHHGTATETFHHAVRDGDTTLESDAKEHRVKALVEWLDLAAGRAESKSAKQRMPMGGFRGGGMHGFPDFPFDEKGEGGAEGGGE
jgi:hypothetical protein